MPNSPSVLYHKYGNKRIVVLIHGEASPPKSGEIPLVIGMLMVIIN